ncbi:MAG TPA: hypothetical protein VNN72_02470 [Polyangiaceae bacterium]|nr:hypothetical protein [Polyangiaceae bacterium]
MAGRRVAAQNQPLQISSLRVLASVALELLGQQVKKPDPEAHVVLAALHGGSSASQHAPNALPRGSREEAAEVLTKLTVSRYSNLSDPAALSALRVASWLSKGSVRRALAQARVAAPEALRDATECIPDAGVISLTRDRRLKHARCNLSIPEGKSPVAGHQLAEIVARFSGARVVIWDGARGPNLTASTPELRQLRGPRWFEVDGVRDPASAARNYAAFSAGVSEFFRAQGARAGRDLRSALELSPQARAWKAVLLEDTDVSNRAAGSQDAVERWPGLVARALGNDGVSASEKGPILDPKLLAAIEKTVPFLPEPSVCAPELAELTSDGVDTLRAAESKGLLARLHAKIGATAREASSRDEHFSEALRLVEEPESGWQRDVTLRLVFRSLPQDSALAGRASKLWHDALEASVYRELFDRIPGYEGRILDDLRELTPGAVRPNVGEAMSLYSTAFRDPAVRAEFEKKVTDNLADWPSWVGVAMGAAGVAMSGDYDIGINAYLQDWAGKSATGITFPNCARAAQALMTIVPQLRVFWGQKDPALFDTAHQILAPVHALGGADDLRGAVARGVPAGIVQFATVVRTLGAAVDTALSVMQGSNWEAFLQGGEYDLLLSLGETQVGIGRGEEARKRVRALVELIRELGPLGPGSKDQDKAAVARALDNARQKSAAVAANFRVPPPTDASWLPYAEIVALDAFVYLEASHGESTSRQELRKAKASLDQLLTSGPGTSSQLVALAAPLKALVLALHDNLAEVANDATDTLGLPLLRAVAKSKASFEKALSEREIYAGLSADQPGYLAAFWMRELARAANVEKDWGAVAKSAAKSSWELLRRLDKQSVPATKAYLVLALGLLGGGDGPNDALDLLASAERTLSGTPFSAHGHVFERTRHEMARTHAKLDVAKAALDAQAKECPGLGWEDGFLRALLLDRSNDAPAASRELSAYRRGGRTMRQFSAGLVGIQSFGVGALGTRTALVTKIRGDVDTKSASLALRKLFSFELGRAFSARGGGSFQVGYGMESNASVETLAERPTIDPKIQITTIGSADDASVMGLATEVFIGTRHANPRMVERALARMQNTLNGMSEDVLDAGVTDRIEVATPTLDSADVALPLWVATLAEANGHHHLSQSLLGLAHAFPTSQVATVTDEQCPKGSPSPEDEPRLLGAARCRIPRYFEDHPGRGALRDLVFLTLKRSAKLPVSDSELEKAIDKAHRLAPEFVPARRAQGKAPDSPKARAVSLARTASGGESDSALLASLTGSGYSCEIASDLLSRSDANLLVLTESARACGLPGVYMEALLKSARTASDPARAYADLEKAIDLSARFGVWDDDLSNAIDQLLNRERLQQFSVRARQLAGRVSLRQFPVYNVRLRAVALASDLLAEAQLGESPETLLYDAQQHEVRPSETVLLRALVFKPNDPILLSTARKMLGIAPEKGAER